MEHRDRIILQKVLSEIDVAQKMMNDCTLEQFLENEMLMRAVGMTVINIGELVKNLTEETRLKYPHIPWKAIAGFRDMQHTSIRLFIWKMYMRLSLQIFHYSKTISTRFSKKKQAVPSTACLHFYVIFFARTETYL